jgi:hypothetical protein
MQQDEQETKVVFRKFKDGDVIAIFPQVPGDSSPYTCLSYMHVGQHNACDPQVVWDTNLATEEEYASLKSELERHYGYRLIVGQRITQKDQEIRRKELKEQHERANRV